MAETIEPLAENAKPHVPSASEKIVVKAVYIMGIMLVVMFIVLMAGIVWKVMKREPVLVGVAAPVTDLGLKAGATVQSMLLDGDRLVINSGPEIIIFDIRKNAIVARLATNPK